MAVPDPEAGADWAGFAGDDAAAVSVIADPPAGDRSTADAA